MKIAKKLFGLLMALVVMAGAASCSDKEGEGDPEKPKKGKMTGWVKIDGKKYDFGNFYGFKNSSDTEIDLTGFSKDPYKLKETEYYNMVDLTIAFNADGTWVDTPNRYENTFDIEIELNTRLDENTDKEQMFSSIYGDMEGVTCSRNGDALYIDGQDVRVQYGQPGGGISSNAPTTTISFHFEGTPTFMSEDDF